MNIEKQLKLRNVSSKDSKTLWQWRNDQNIRKHFFDSSPVPWQEHQTWFSDRLQDPFSKIYIAVHKEKKIGVIRFQIKKKSATVSINVNPRCLGRGFGVSIIKQGTKKFSANFKNKAYIFAHIKIDNISSQKAFAKAGYNLQKIGKKEVVYRYKIQ